jgi:hypothetical protein
MKPSRRLIDPLSATDARVRPLPMLIAAAALTVAFSTFAVQRAEAGPEDSAAVRGYIVPTANNPDVNPATTCSNVFASNDQFDYQPQSPTGTADNAVTLAGCSYNAIPFGGPSTEDRPVAFEVVSGSGGLLCGQGLQQSRVCALPGINHAPGQEYRVVANNEAGENAAGSMTVKFCADDPPAEGKCGTEDEEATTFTILWQAGGGTEGGQAGDPCQAPNCIAAGGTPTGAVGNRRFITEVTIPSCQTRQVRARVRIKKLTVRGRVVVKVAKIVFRLDRGRRKTDRRPPYRKTFSLRKATPGSLHTLTAKISMSVRKGNGKTRKRTLTLSKQFRFCPSVQ